jgi:putative transcription antitermination factor YqgF
MAFMSAGVAKVYAIRIRPCPALALDIGTSFVGVASTTDLHSAGAVPLKSYLHLYPTDPDHFPARLQNLIQAHRPELLIVGWPAPPPGQQSICGFIQRFVANLQRSGIQLPVVQQDESHTTSQARRELRQLSKSVSENKDWLDQVAACFVLKRFADSLKATPHNCSNSED